MTFEEYQKLSRKSAAYPAYGSSYVYPVMGLTSEAGEVADKFKKAIRDEGGENFRGKKDWDSQGAWGCFVVCFPNIFRTRLVIRGSGQSQFRKTTFKVGTREN